MQHAIERVGRPGGSLEGVGRKKKSAAAPVEAIGEDSALVGSLCPGVLGLGTSDPSSQLVQGCLSNLEKVLA